MRFIIYKILKINGRRIGSDGRRRRRTNVRMENMAEAAVENPPGRFFCHKCAQEIIPVLPDFTCPRCQSGFIEELGQNSTDSASDFPEEDRGANGPYSEIMSVIIDGLSGDPNDSIFASEDVGGFRRLRRNRSQGANSGSPRLQTRRRASADRGMAPFEGLVQQILTNLTGAAFQVTGNSGTGIPVFFNLHGNPGDYAWGNRGLDAVITQLLNQLDGTGPPPLPTDRIEQIPTVFISQEQVDVVLQCTVCMEDFKLGEPVRKLECLHHFHNDCIVPWLELHGTCPICRKSLNAGEGNDRSSPDPNNGAERGEGQFTNMDSQSSSSSSSSTSSRASNSSSSQTPNPAVYDFIEEYD